MDQSYAPIVVFAYNRVDKLENCLASLEKCIEASSSDLYLFCDGPKSDKDADAVAAVHKFAAEYADRKGFRSINVSLQEKNRGLAASIISGVTDVVNKYGKVIVVEDDLVVFPTFLKYLNEGLAYYRNDPVCGSVSAFTYPIKELDKYDGDVYSTYKAECWGWATWADRWDNASWADTDFTGYLSDMSQRRRFESLEAGLDRLMYLQYKGRIDSWAVRWVYHLFKTGRLTVYPAASHVANEGFDGSGTHCANGFGADFNSAASMSSKEFRWIKCELNDKLAKAYARFPRRKLLFYIPETVRYMLKRH